MQTLPHGDVSCAVDAVGKIHRYCVVERPENEARQLEGDLLGNSKPVEFRVQWCLVIKLPAASVSS